MVSIVSLSLDRKIKEGTNINAAQNALREIKDDEEIQRI